MSTDTFTILTKCKTGQSHRETKVSICWDNITEQQLKTGFRAYIIHVLQAQWKYVEEKVPENVTVQATSMIHAEVFVPREYVPRKKLSPFEQMFAELTPEQVAELLAGL